MRKKLQPSAEVGRPKLPVKSDDSCRPYYYGFIMEDSFEWNFPCITSNIKREKRPPSPEDDDVIILSDNDSPSPPMNGLSHFKELDTDLLMVRKLALACQLFGFFPQP